MAEQELFIFVASLHKPRSMNNSIELPKTSNPQIIWLKKKLKWKHIPKAPFHPHQELQQDQLSHAEEKCHENDQQLKFSSLSLNFMAMDIR